MSQTRDLNPLTTTAILVVVVGLLLFSGWFIWLRQPPQKLPPGVTDPTRLTEDYYTGRYRPGVGYVNTPQAPPPNAGRAPR